MPTRYICRFCMAAYMRRSQMTSDFSGRVYAPFVNERLLFLFFLRVLMCGFRSEEVKARVVVRYHVKKRSLFTNASRTGALLRRLLAVKYRADVHQRGLCERKHEERNIFTTWTNSGICIVTHSLGSYSRNKTPRNRKSRVISPARALLRGGNRKSCFFLAPPNDSLQIGQ